MTTKVTVDAHAGWPVEVIAVDLDNDGRVVGESQTTVAPHTTQDFYVHSHRELRVKEMPNG
ncbi:MAG: hypothetical protein J0H00_19745 [Burkholderiales bacterium]|nr:hypothetical protein [Burkholderiales bacterium]